MRTMDATSAMNTERTSEHILCDCEAIANQRILSWESNCEAVRYEESSLLGNPQNHQESEYRMGSLE